MGTFVIPADYLLALVDVETYPSFVTADWTRKHLRRHLLSGMKDGTILAWGTGAPGNWCVEVINRQTAENGFRFCRGRIRATHQRLYLTSYDELTTAAQFENIRLPRPGTADWSVKIAPGEYDCRVVQLYDPTLAESEEVFNQQTPHFRVELVPASAKLVQAVRRIPWFEFA